MTFAARKWKADLRPLAAAVACCLAALACDADRGKVVTLTATGAGGAGGGAGASTCVSPGTDPFLQSAEQALLEGRNTFRFDTFGDEAFWGDTLKLHQAIEGSKFGGVGPGVSPKTALSVGLKVDAEALPSSLVEKVKHGDVNLDDPATTLALLKLNAVVGITGFFNSDGSLKSIGIQCALCHSTVDQSFSTGGIPAGNIGRRLDGWPNRDL